jgi:hypothetical protein
MRRIVDRGLNHNFTPDDLRAWPSRILLPMADDDRAPHGLATGGQRSHETSEAGEPASAT